jgi:hypothetical protein
VKVQCNQTHDDKHSEDAAVMSVFVCKQQREHMNLPQYLQQQNVSAVKTFKKNIYNNIFHDL